MVPAFQLDDSTLVSAQEHILTRSGGFWRSCRSLSGRISWHRMTTGIHCLLYSSWKGVIFTNVLLTFRTSRLFGESEIVIKSRNGIRSSKLLQDLQKPSERVGRCSCTLTSVESSNWNAGTIGMDPILYAKKRQRCKKIVTLMEKLRNEVMNSSELS